LFIVDVDILQRLPRPPCPMELDFLVGVIVDTFLAALAITPHVIQFTMNCFDVCIYLKTILMDY